MKMLFFQNIVHLIIKMFNSCYLMIHTVANVCHLKDINLRVEISVIVQHTQNLGV